ncbi:adenylate/guanylate cyclase domain-containing protein [Demetria terragena]|uniref:adenylate/guanylate cyclase domain-containing protein n=1 Tax=Demetria terragena TaxID=63959 RepID=UPI0012EA57AD|nr:adenylate/guanylate cyclase domain-containing protein [Demetria terragena]
MTTPHGFRDGDDRARFVDAIHERVMQSPRTLRRAEIAERAGVDPERTRELWRALGFANARDDDIIFTERDAEALRQVTDLVGDDVISEATTRGLARAYGRSMDRLAMWQTQVLSDLVTGEQLALDSESARRTAELTADLADRLEPLLVYVWRRNVAQAVSRLVADSEPESHLGVRRTVGFADLVSFTSLVRRLSERDLAELVTRFEALASDMVSLHGGALIKTVGDEILFTHESPADAAAIALDLVDAVDRDDLIPHLRVGLSQGRVLARQGDVYGDTVNRAARLTATARPGGVLVDHDVAWSIATHPRFTVEELDAIDLAGIGTLRPWTLTRGPGGPTDEEETAWLKVQENL